MKGRTIVRSYPSPLWVWRPSNLITYKMLKELTISVYPQERTSGFPVFENSAACEPVGCSPEMSLPQNVVICGRIRR